MGSSVDSSGYGVKLRASLSASGTRSLSSRKEVLEIPTFFKGLLAFLLSPLTYIAVGGSSLL